MTYTEMISVMDTNAIYTNRGRKGYKKANEKWTLTISTNYQNRTLTAYLKTEMQGREWIERELAQCQRTIDHRNIRWDNDEKITGYIVQRIDRMGKEYNECMTISTKTRM